MTIIDHDEPQWAFKYRSLGRENGAATYSRDLVEWQVPVWSRLLKKYGFDDAVLSTCRLMAKMQHTSLPPKTRLVVQYLHAFAYANPIKEVESVIAGIPTRYEHICFVTAYRPLHEYLKWCGIDSIFVPMTIDSERVQSFAVEERVEANRVIWLGNVIGKRSGEYPVIKATLERHGYRVDTISMNRLNGGEPNLTQENIWSIVSQYRYGVGVGRSALEMLALGLKTMFVGTHFGGIVTNDSEWEYKRSINFATKNPTYSGDMNRCINDFDKSLVRTSCIRQELPGIEQSIEDYLARIAS